VGEEERAEQRVGEGSAKKGPEREKRPEEEESR